MQEKIREVLSGVIDPNTGKDLVSSKALKKVTTEDGKNNRPDRIRLSGQNTGTRH